MGYVVVAVTLGAGFEQDLAAAAEREGVALNAVATSAQAQITHDHGLYALITGLVPVATPGIPAPGRRQGPHRGRRTTRPPRMVVGTGHDARGWTYVALGLGLFADPQNLPPLVRDFGPLTAPLVSALSLLALGSLVFTSEAVRGAEVTHRSARVATVVSILLGALSLLALFATGFEDPVAPIVIVPGALILGIALLRSKRRPATGTR